MIKMCVFDVDGTLYDYFNHCILKSTIEALKQLQNNGILVVVATGRCHYALGSDLDALNFDYILGVNGGVIVDKEKSVLYRKDFSREDVEKINAFANRYDAGLIWKFIDHMYVYQNKEKVDWYEAQSKSDMNCKLFIDCPTKDHHLIDYPQSCSIHADIKWIEKEFKASSTIEYLQYSSDGFDFVSKGFNKGQGVLKLMELLGLKNDEIMVFGDNYNDLSMFDVATYRIAMGNSVDEIKKNATYVTEDCAHDGIYNACKHFKLI